MTGNVTCYDAIISSGLARHSKNFVAIGFAFEIIIGQGDKAGGVGPYLQLSCDET